MLKIDLINNYGFTWKESNRCFAKGYLFDEDNKLFQNEEILEYFKNIKSEDDFCEKLKIANGIFSVVLNLNNKLYAAVDITRTFPIFYYSDDKGNIHIADDTYFLRKEYSNDIDKNSKEEFLLTGYVTDKYTLLKNVFQIQAGEFLVIEKGDIKTKFYFEYADKEIKTFNQNLSKVLDNTITRLINFAQGKTIVIPLSGGYDSRLIASLLKIKNYKNVICFTYGKPDSFEVAISKKVANILGYYWHYIEYDEKLIQEDFLQDNDFASYYKFAANSTSVFLTQDYFAVKYLHDNNLIPGDSVIVPGHSGDFLAGSHYVSLDKNQNNEYIIDKILRAHYTKNPINNKSLQISKDKINKFINSRLNFASEQLLDTWNQKERQAKFIVNSLTVYNHFGYESAIPLWDKELVAFFKNLEFEDRLYSKYYVDHIFNNFFKELNVDFYKDKAQSKVNKRNKFVALIIKFIKLILPNKIVVLIREYLTNDTSNFDLVIKSLNKDASLNYAKYDINAAIASWYIFKLEKEEI